MPSEPRVSRRTCTQAALAASAGSLLRPAPAPVRAAESADAGSEEEMRRQAACFQLVYDSGRRYVNDHSFIRGKDG